MIKTKIICTIGPSVSSFEQIVQLVQAGMNVARLNFSHGTHEEHARSIEWLKRAREVLDVPLAIMLDTKGPEIRLGEIRGGQTLLETGQEWFLSSEAILGDQEHVSITPPHILPLLPVGTRILFDDGSIGSRVVGIEASGVRVRIENGGLIRSKKGVNVPDVSLDLPLITEKDRQDIIFGCSHDVDYIAASFVRSPAQVFEIKKLLSSEKKGEILVIAKIENREGVENFDGIVQIADGIMVARGDLGVEMPLNQVPRLQKMMIRKSYLAGKPVVTATQMLESMIYAPRPTRAEVSDVANAIYDSTSAVMLSGETASGKYPIESVAVMRSIIEEAENDFNYRLFFDEHVAPLYHDVPSAVARAAVTTANDSGAKGIFVFTERGDTARLLSRYRPKMPIFALTKHATTYHQLALTWGVVPLRQEHYSSIEAGFCLMAEYAMQRGLLAHGDLVVVTAGNPLNRSGTTNMMMVESIGDVLVRGESGYGARVHGKVAFLFSLEEEHPYRVKDQIIVISRCDDSYLPFAREAAGVILQNHIDDAESERYGREMIGSVLGKPVLLRADGAARVLKEGQLVTLDPEKAIVYKGIVE